MAEARPCRATKQGGDPCRATALPGSDYCFFHAPNRAAERDAGRRAGGKERSKKAVVLPENTADLPLTSVADVTTALATTVNQVRRGELDVKAANAVGYLCSVLLKALEESTLEKELQELRRAVAEVQARGNLDQAAGGGETPAGPRPEDSGRQPIAGGAATGPGATDDPGGTAPGPVAGSAPARLF
ncbi:MAG TPA: hypothetical protein VEL76_15000 [Gemmataceae bacterium]|nr:hypothetical protein [Gemmataceae bacterium]